MTDQCPSHPSAHDGVAPQPSPSRRVNTSNSELTERKDHPVGFYESRPNKLCVTCFSETGQATGLIFEKGGDPIPCPDCHPTCYHCMFCAHPIVPGGDVWCSKHGQGKGAFMLCDQYIKRTW